MGLRNVIVPPFVLLYAWHNVRLMQVSGKDYTAASPDPVAPFSAPICGHMNADHSDSTAAMVFHYAGIQVWPHHPTRHGCCTDTNRGCTVRSSPCMAV